MKSPLIVLSLLVSVRRRVNPILHTSI
ncbi:UNVERIFIED_CONTAM: hypothetical protein GTU68_050355 [Idotea baltica]|nr:hypothetical protein [Idotea baltica]